MKVNYCGLLALLVAGLIMTSCAKPEEELRKAIDKNDKDTVASIIKDKKINLNFYGKDANKASLLSITTHKPEIFYMLIDSGAKINPKSVWEKDIINRVILSHNNHKNSTPDQKKMISILLKQGANINAESMNGINALGVVKSLDMFKFLLDNGADPKLKSKNNIDTFEKLFKISSKGKIKKQNYVFLRELQKRKLNSSDPKLAKKINSFLNKTQTQEKSMGNYITALIAKVNPRKDGSYSLDVKLDTKFKFPVRYVYGILLVELNGDRLVQKTEFINHASDIKPGQSLKIISYCNKKAGKVLAGNLAKLNTVFLVTSYSIAAKTSTGYKKIELEKYNVRD